MRWTEVQIHLHISFVDCSFEVLVSQCPLAKDFQRTYIVTLLWLPKPNVLGGQTDNVPLVVDDTGPGTAGAYIYTDLSTVLHEGCSTMLGGYG